MNMKIDLSDLIQDTRKFVTIYINFETVKYVSDVIDYICTVLQLPVQANISSIDAGELSLFDDIWYIPPRQSSFVLRGTSGILRLSYVQADGSVLNSLPTALPSNAEKETVCIPAQEALAQECLLSDERNLSIFHEAKEESLEDCQYTTREVSNDEHINNQMCIQSSFNDDSKSSFGENDAENSVMLHIVKDVELKSEQPKCNDTTAVQSTESPLEDLCNLPEPQKRKRKRKHGKKKKKLKEEHQENTYKRVKYQVHNDFSVESRKEDVLLKRSHVVFNESDKESDSHLRNVKENSLDYYVDNSSTLQPCESLQPHESQLVHSTPMMLSQSLNRTQENQAKAIKIVCESTEDIGHGRDDLNDLDISCIRKAPHTDSVHPVYSDTVALSGCSDDSEMLTKCPPQPSHNSEEPSAEILSKFKKLLGIESKLRPVVFRRETNDLKNHSVGMEEWDSLPLSFASRKDKTKNISPHYDFISSFSPFSSNETAVADHCGFKNTSIQANSGISDGEEEPPVQAHVGAKPTRKGKYFQSIGSVLSALKNSENTVSTQSKNKILSTCPRPASPCYTKTDATESVDERSSDPSFDKAVNDSDDSGSEDSRTCNEKVPRDVRDTNLKVDEAESCSVEKSLPRSARIDLNVEDVERKSDGDYTSIPVYDLEEDDKENQASCNISYELYPLMSTLPKIGDIIATKLLTLDSSMCPQHSEYRPAKVVSVDELKLRLQFLDILSCDPSALPRCTVMDWRDMISPRLVFP